MDLLYRMEFSWIECYLLDCMELNKIQSKVSPYWN